MGTRQSTSTGHRHASWAFGAAVGAAWALWICAALAAPANADDASGKPPIHGDTLITAPVLRGAYVHDVSSRGQVESSVNVEVRCEVKLNWSWIRILDVVPEGTKVKPGDFLVRLDSSGLETDRVRQEALCHQARIVLEQARAAYANAKDARAMYLGGEYQLAKAVAESNLFRARERWRQAKDVLERSKALHAKGFITRPALDADAFALAAADTQRKLATHQLEVLERYTKPARLCKIEASLAITQARLRSAELNAKIQQNLLDDIDLQIRRCVVVAPVAGEVVLAHIHHNNHSHMIEPGEETMERRTLVRLPDCRHMQVLAKIEEDDVARVKPGMPARIRLDAYPDRELTGSVTKVNEFPEAEEWMASAVKVYQTVVRIDKPFEGMKPGLTAQVDVRIEQLADQLQVPVQAVLKEAGKAFCLVESGGALEATPVELGPNNATQAVIRRGLREGQNIVVNAAAHRRDVALPGGEPSDAPSARAESRFASLPAPVRKPWFWGAACVVVASGALLRIVKNARRERLEAARS